jgi:hypothetical protein
MGQKTLPGASARAHARTFAEFGELLRAGRVGTACATCSAPGGLISSHTLRILPTPAASSSILPPSGPLQGNHNARALAHAKADHDAPLRFAKRVL